MAAALAGQRVSGWVRKFQGAWGFLNSDAFEGDLFVGLKGNPHLGRLSPDERVEFDVEVKGSKAEAVNVTGSDGAGSEAAQCRGQRFLGWVKRFRGDWGFINSDSYDGDIFVGLKKNPGILIRQDDQVEFEIEENNGKSEAVRVHVLPPAPSASSQSHTVGGQGQGSKADVGHLVGQELFGRIKSFRDKWGFVVSDSFSGDLFIHLRSNKELVNVSAGDLVQFRIEEDPKTGGYQAANATLEKSDPAELVGQQIQGWVKSFRGKWGFVNSHRFEGDVFVGANANRQLGQQGLTPGEPVQFEIASDAKSERGVEAVKVQRVLDMSGRPAAVVPMRSMSVGVPQARAIVPTTNGHRSHGRQTAPAYNGPSDLASLQGRHCTGEVRSFRETWGFVVSHMFVGDLFVGARSNPDLRGLQQGDQIEFTVEAAAGSKSGFEAVNVRPLRPGQAASRVAPLIVSRDRSARGSSLGAPHAAARDRSARDGSTRQGSMQDRSRSPRGASRDPGQYVGQVVSGWIRSFKGTWGFVNSESFDGDVFMGAKSNPNLPSQISPDHPVQFEVTQGKGGKLEAANVVLL